MQGEKVISALIGLTGAVANNGKTEHTDQVVREAVLQLSDSSREAELVEKIHTEKHRIAPDCATCTHPCGNTSDYEIEKLSQAEKSVQDKKEEMLLAMKQYLSESETVPETVYRGIAYLGYDLEPESYDEVKNAFVDDSTVWKYNG